MKFKWEKRHLTFLSPQAFSEQPFPLQGRDEVSLEGYFGTAPSALGPCCNFSQPQPVESTEGVLTAFVSCSFYFYRHS